MTQNGADTMEIEPVHEAEIKIDDKASTKSSLMWIEKYRPRTLESLLSHQDIIATLTRLIRARKLPHLLFHGPPGTGKTSTILACAREMYGNDYAGMVLELNASDDRGIDVVRDQIKSFASTRKIFSSGIKLIILDEADAMTQAAQMALRRVIEAYSHNVRFCVICNYVNKIIPAVQSRCTKFRFGPLQPDHIRPRLREIAQIEGLDLQKSGLEALILLGRGDMRRSLNLLQSVCLASRLSDRAQTAIDEELVFRNAGIPLPKDVTQVLEWMLNDSFVECAEKFIEYRREEGVAMVDIIAELHRQVLAGSFPVEAKKFALCRMAEMELRLAVGCSEKVNMTALIGIFKFVATMTIEAGST